MDKLSTLNNMSLLSSFWNQFLEYVEKDKKREPFALPLLKQLVLMEITEEKIVLACDNQGLKSYLERKLSDLEKVISDFTQKKIKAELVVEIKKRSLKKEVPPLLAFESSFDNALLRAGLHSKYRFENFAVSSTNQVAFAAAQAVADSPGTTYNPLFLYGGVGVGKTHISQAIARKILEKWSEKKILFCPGDNFTNELVEAIRDKTTAKFRRRFRQLNLLLIDDIQFIAGKNHIQEEFFHTFNSIISSGGQIVITSDRAPSEIKNLEDRLRSRFSGGLTIDIQPPGFELKTAILLIKAKEKNIEIDIEAAKAIAERVGDTRELEGTLLSIYTRSLGRKERIDMELIDDFFFQKEKVKIKKIDPQDVLKSICSFYNVKISHLKGGSRTSHIVLPRQITMYILRQELNMKLDDVAFFLKRKDHTTVMHATEKITRLMVKDPLFKKEIDQFVLSLNLST